MNWQMFFAFLRENPVIVWLFVGGSLAFVMVVLALWATL